MNFSASSNELIPPAALIFVPLEILSAKIFTTWNVAPSVEKPVEVLMKSAFDIDTTLVTLAISSSVNKQVSTITLSNLPSQASFILLISQKMSSHLPSLAHPILITISISAAPSLTACAASAHLISVVLYPLGKPITVQIAICTVIGFPNGYNTTEIKCAEAAQAVKEGAAEIDMVINIGWAKEGRWDDIFCEINKIKEACDGRLLKVIVETCLLTDEEIAKVTNVVSMSKADFIKTSTGFSTEGATFHVVKIFADNISNGTKIKAAGGISSLEDAEKFIELGADRLGTSRIVKIVKNENAGANEY